MINRDQLEDLAAVVPREVRPPARNGRPGTFDLDLFLRDNNVGVYRDLPWNGGRKILLVECPFDSSHRDGDAAIMTFSSGAQEFKCFHDHCARYAWADVREKFEPGYRKRSTSNEFSTPRPNGKTHAAVPLMETAHTNGAITPGGGAVMDVFGRGIPVRDIEMIDPADRAAFADEIHITDRGLPELTERAVAALVRANNPPRLFRQAGGIARLQRDEEDHLVLVRLDMHRTRFEMAKAASWVRTQFNQIVATFPPDDVVENLLATPELPFPPIRGIVSAPFFDHGGTLVLSDGYHETSRVYLANDVVVSNVSLVPTADDIRNSVNAIDDVIADFPFLDKSADRANAIALMLLPFVREMIDGPTPLHFFTAPSPGTGKGKLAEVMLIPACGSVPMGGLGKNEEEIRKGVTTFLLTGRPARILDNVTGMVDSASLARLLTAGLWEDRILGGNVEAVLPNRAAWAATGNNAVLSTELARRSIEIRLDARVERPQQRDKFRYPNLLEHVLENRGRLVAAALTLVQAWIAAGRPAGAETMGSYESWARVIGGILNVAGITGLIANADRLLEAADEESENWRFFVAAWAERYHETSLTPKELLPLASAVVGETDEGKERAQVTRLGQHLTAHRDRVFGDWRIERGENKREGKTWRLVAAEPRRTSTPEVLQIEPSKIKDSQNPQNLQNLSETHA